MWTEPESVCHKFEQTTSAPPPHSIPGIKVLITKNTASSNWAAQKFHVEIFNLKKLNEPQVRKQYEIKISNRYADLN
jgi:hypothetical protein